MKLNIYKNNLLRQGKVKIIQSLELIFFKSALLLAIQSVVIDS